MMRGGVAAVLVALLAGGALAGGAMAGCGRSGAPTGGSASGAGRPKSIVALGDSVPRGTNCDCTPYPPLTADDLGARTGFGVSAANDSVAGNTTSNVLRQLDRDRSVITDVGAADVVEIEVGANDVAQSDSCGTTISCYRDEVPQVEQNLMAIVARVHELTGGAHVQVVLLDYWSVWLGGSYAAAEGDAYTTTAKELTDEINAAIKSVAASSGSTYVDLRAAFKGPDYAYDETHYLSDDGDHPNAAGHQQIADAAATAIASALHIR